MEFKSNARPIFSANVCQGVDRTQRSIGCIEGVGQRTLEPRQINGTSVCFARALSRA